MPKGKRNSPSMYGISETPNHWSVILRRDKKQFSKPFAFSTYGGKRLALVAAQAWRDHIVQAHPQMTKRKRAERLRSTNKTGIAGIRCRLGPDGEPISVDGPDQDRVDITAQVILGGALWRTGQGARDRRTRETFRTGSWSRLTSSGG